MNVSTLTTMTTRQSGPSYGVYVGAGVGACVVIIGVVAVVVCCYVKSRKQRAHSNMTKSSDVFSTAASNTQYDHPPSRSRVNRYPDPEQEMRARRQENDSNNAHVHSAFIRYTSGNNTSSNSDNEPFTSESSLDDSSYSIDYDVDNDAGRYRASFKAAKRNDVLYMMERQSRRDNFTKNRNPRSDSPLTVATLEKYEQITRKSEQPDEIQRKDSRTQRPEVNIETCTSISSDSRYIKKKRLQNSQYGSKRYKRDSSKERKSHTRPSRSRSAEGRSKNARSPHGNRERSRSPGRSSQNSTGSWHSRSTSKSINREQVILPIFAEAKNKRR